MQASIRVIAVFVESNHHVSNNSQEANLPQRPNKIVAPLLDYGKVSRAALIALLCC